MTKLPSYNPKKGSYGFSKPWTLLPNKLAYNVGFTELPNKFATKTTSGAKNIFVVEYSEFLALKRGLNL